MKNNSVQCKCGRVELSFNECEEIKTKKGYVVTYKTVYEVRWSNAQKRYIGSKLYTHTSNYTLRGRYMILTAHQINRWIGFKLLNEEHYF